MDIAMASAARTIRSMRFAATWLPAGQPRFRPHRRPARAAAVCSLADRSPPHAGLGAAVLAGSAYILALPAFSQRLLEAMLAGPEDVRSGSLAAAFAILFLPVTLLGL